MLKDGQSAGMQGSTARPASVGRRPRMYCVTAVCDQDAVPVSQEFLPSPGVAAAGPATICAYT